MRCIRHEPRLLQLTLLHPSEQIIQCHLNALQILIPGRYPYIIRINGDIRDCLFQMLQIYLITAHI